MKRQGEIRKRLGQLLIERGWITGEQLIRAIQSQRMIGGRIGTCLLEMDVLTEDRLLEALSNQLAVPAVRIDELRTIDMETLGLVPSRLAVRCQAVPVEATSGELSIATLHVNNLAFLDEIAFFANRKVRPLIANEARVFEALERYYGVDCPRRYGHLLDRLNRVRYMWDDKARTLLGVVEEDKGFTWHQPQDVLEHPPIQLKRDRRPAGGNGAGTPLPSNGNRTGSRDADRALTLEEMDDLLGGQLGQQEIGETLLRFMKPRFARTLVFKVQQHRICGWLGHGQGVKKDALEQLAIGLEEPSAFLALHQGAELHLGPLTPMPAHRQLAACWGGSLPRSCLMVPVRLRDRMVVVLYGEPADQVGDEEGGAPALLQRLAQKAAMAFELCILRRKIHEV